MAINYRQIEPPAYLRSFVRYFWTLDHYGPPDQDRSFRTIADGSPGLVFQHADKGALYREGEQLPLICLYGQSTVYSELKLKGSFRTIGIFFYPNALKGIFGIDAGELTDSCMDMGQLISAKKSALSEQLLNAGTIEERIEILSAYLYAELQRNRQATDEATQYALDRISAARGNISMKDLQTTLQLSERTLERRFRQQIGITPKLFSRICRFQETLLQLKNNGYEKLSDIAYENGYADQSHFIRAFKEFTGTSPFQYQQTSSEIVENLTELRK